VLEHFLGHALGQIHQAVIIEDLHAPDVLGIEFGLVGDRTDDVAGLHAVLVADFDAVGFETLVALGRALARRALVGVGVGFVTAFFASARASGERPRRRRG